MSALCAICGKRPATVPDCIDGRTYLVCAPCRDGEVTATPVPSVPARVLRLVRRSPGITRDELAMVIDDSEIGRRKISDALRRARSGREVVSVGDGAEWYHYPRRGYRTRVRQRGER